MKEASLNIPNYLLPARKYKKSKSLLHHPRKKWKRLSKRGNSSLKKSAPKKRLKKPKIQNVGRNAIAYKQYVRSFSCQGLTVCPWTMVVFSSLLALPKKNLKRKPKK